MTTRYDMLDAKDAWANHMAEHKCGFLTPCADRTKLWSERMKTAALWGMEPGDDDRQRAQFHQLNPNAIS